MKSKNATLGNVFLPVSSFCINKKSFKQTNALIVPSSCHGLIFHFTLQDNDVTAIHFKEWLIFKNMTQAKLREMVLSEFHQ